MPLRVLDAARANAWSSSGATYSANSIGEYRADRDYFWEASCTLVKTNMPFSIITILSQNFTAIYFILKSV